MEVQESSGAEVYMLHGKSSFVASKILDIDATAPTNIRDTSHGVVVGVPARNYLILHSKPPENSSQCWTRWPRFAQASVKAIRARSTETCISGTTLSCSVFPALKVGRIYVDVNGAPAAALAGLDK
jgi:hypothetical protein